MIRIGHFRKMMGERGVELEGKKMVRFYCIVLGIYANRKTGFCLFSPILLQCFWIVQMIQIGHLEKVTFLIVGRFPCPFNSIKSTRCH